jgi:hypothetical protein
MRHHKVQERLDHSTQYRKWVFSQTELQAQNSARIEKYSSLISRYYPESGLQVNDPYLDV